MIENLKRGRLSEQLWVKQHIFWQIILKESVKKVLIKADILTILKNDWTTGREMYKKRIGSDLWTGDLEYKWIVFSKTN